MKKLIKSMSKTVVLCILSIFTALYAHAQTSMDYNILIRDIEFTPGVTIDINVKIYVNENALNWSNQGKIFAIEGMAHTAACWKPFAEEIFLRTDPELEINEFYAIDMPGRGGSGFPEGDGFLYENLYIEHYLNIIREVLYHLANVHGVRPNTIIGHSMGGLEVIMLQNELIREGTNLRAEFGFKNAVLLAPAIPAPLDWEFINGGGSSELRQYVVYVPGLGTILELPFYVWPIVFFTNSCCYFAPNMIPGAPTPLQVLNNGYNSIEPAPLLFEISGMIPPLPYPYKPRVSADPNIFKAKHGVQLTVIADEFDKNMPPYEVETLYDYLTGDKKQKRFIVVKGEKTCHDTHISDPYAIVTQLNLPFYFR